MKKSVRVRYFAILREQRGLDEERIGVGGDSVGGALATIVARKGRDVGMPFAAQLLHRLRRCWRVPLVVTYLQEGEA